MCHWKRKKNKQENYEERMSRKGEFKGSEGEKEVRLSERGGNEEGNNGVRKKGVKQKEVSKPGRKE